ncbi:MAG: HPF/RaiA family ribosome-associated protein [Paraburkholderia sp.]|uniref:HPF/RaiA family ribosome-associated protein n=1 Tax=Paraburkholderia sp. TaxID=1926495 RepID=UPI003C361CEE
MQIAYLGFAGTSQIESEAASRLVRLERFSRSMSGCHLAVEFIGSSPGRRGYDMQGKDRHGPAFDARLDLIMRNGEFVAVRHCVHTDATAAIDAVFDFAEQQLERRMVGTSA